MIDAFTGPDPTATESPGDVVHHVHVAHRISILISAFGVVASTLLLVGAVREYWAGATPLWVGAGVLIFLAAVHALVRDVRGARRARTGPSA
ncbi:hypothetical protein [Streptomyces sp. NPDC055709]